MNSRTTVAPFILRAASLLGVDLGDGAGGNPPRRLDTIAGSADEHSVRAHHGSAQCFLRWPNSAPLLLDQKLRGRVVLSW